MSRRRSWHSSAIASSTRCVPSRPATRTLRRPLGPSRRRFCDVEDVPPPGTGGRWSPCSRRAAPPAPLAAHPAAGARFLMTRSIRPVPAIATSRSAKYGATMTATAPTSGSAPRSPPHCGGERRRPPMPRSGRRGCGDRDRAQPGDARPRHGGPRSARQARRLRRPRGSGRAGTQGAGGPPPPTPARPSNGRSIRRSGPAASRHLESSSRTSSAVSSGRCSVEGKPDPRPEAPGPTGHGRGSTQGGGRRRSPGPRRRSSSLLVRDRGVEQPTSGPWSTAMRVPTSAAARTRRFKARDPGPAYEGPPLEVFRVFDIAHVLPRVPFIRTGRGPCSRTAVRAFYTTSRRRRRRDLVALGADLAESRQLQRSLDGRAAVAAACGRRDADVRPERHLVALRAPSRRGGEVGAGLPRPCRAEEVARGRTPRFCRRRSGGLAARIGGAGVAASSHGRPPRQQHPESAPAVPHLRLGRRGGRATVRHAHVHLQLRSPTRPASSG